MISTRSHGLFDCATSLLLGGLAAMPVLPPRVRGVLALAGAVQVASTMLTDYEAGLSPVLTMREHLALEALGGAALGGAGLLMRRQPRLARALLVALGLSEIAATALSSASPLSGPGQRDWATRVFELSVGDGSVGYPPLDTPKLVAPDVFVVDSLMPGLMGHVIAVRMTVLRLPGGDLLLHSPTRFTPGLKAELERIGRVRHLVAPNPVHWIFLKGWQDACPDVTTWAAPGLRERRQVRRSGIRLDHDLSHVAPPEWGGDVALTLLTGGFGFTEIGLFHQPSRTLLLADLAMNLEASKMPALLRPMLRLAGMVAPGGMSPPTLRAVIRLRQREARQAARRMLDQQPERVIFAHGRWFEHDGLRALRHSWRWLLDGSDPA